MRNSLTSSVNLKLTADGGREKWWKRSVVQHTVLGRWDDQDGWRDGGQGGGAHAVKVVGGIDEGWCEMEDGRTGGDSGAEMHCTTVGVGGGDRLCFRSAAGKMPTGSGQTQPVALFEPSQ